MTFFSNEFFVYENPVQIFSSINKDLKIIDFKSDEVSGILVNEKKSSGDNFKYELGLNPKLDNNNSNQVLLKNNLGEILPTNNLKTKLFYNKLFDIRGKSIIKIEKKDDNYELVLTAEYNLLNGENKKIQLFKNKEEKTFAIKTLWDNICYEIDKIQAEKFFGVDKTILLPKEIFYKSEPQIYKLNLFSKSFSYPLEAVKYEEKNLYNATCGGDKFVIHKKDLEQFLSKYFKGKVNVASLNKDKETLDKYGFDSPETILDIKTDTQNKSIYFSKGKGNVDYYAMFDDVPVIYELSMANLPKEDKINKFFYSLGDEENLKSVIYRYNFERYIFEIQKTDGDIKYKYNSRKVPSQFFYDLFDKFYSVNVLEYTSIEGKYRLLDMRLAFKITLVDDNDKETFANFYTLDNNKALMYVGEDEGYIINNSFVEDILNDIQNLNKEKS